MMLWRMGSMAALHRGQRRAHNPWPCSKLAAFAGGVTGRGRTDRLAAHKAQLQLLSVLSVPRIECAHLCRCFARAEP